MSFLQTKKWKIRLYLTKKMFLNDSSNLTHRSWSSIERLLELEHELTFHHSILNLVWMKYIFLEFWKTSSHLLPEALKTLQSINTTPMMRVSFVFWKKSNRKIVHFEIKTSGSVLECQTDNSWSTWSFTSIPCQNSFDNLNSQMLKMTTNQKLGNRFHQCSSQVHYFLKNIRRWFLWFQAKRIFSISSNQNVER